MGYRAAIPSPREERAGRGLGRGVPYLLTRRLFNVGSVAPLPGPLPIPSSWGEGEATAQLALWQLLSSILRMGQSRRAFKPRESSWNGEIALVTLDQGFRVVWLPIDFSVQLFLLAGFKAADARVVVQANDYPLK